MCVEGAAEGADGGADGAPSGRHVAERAGDLGAQPVRVRLWTVGLALTPPVMTPAGPFDTYWHVVVELETAGAAGWGYSALPVRADADAVARVAAGLLSAGEPSVGRLLALEPAAAAPAADAEGARAASLRRTAVNAVSLAVWDLVARALRVPVAGLLRDDPPTSLDCYSSGFFLSASADELRREADDARSGGFRLAKMRVGGPDDLARLRLLTRAFPDAGAVAVDAVCAWTPDEARAFVRAADVPLLWVEDPVPYPRLAELADLPAPVAAGESLTSAAAFDELLVGCRLDDALLDVQMLGGPATFLDVAAAVRARGARVGAHVFTPFSLHLLAALDDPLPVEVFGWSDALLDAPPAPGADGRLAVAGPGFGVTVRPDVLRRRGTLIYSA